MMKIHPDVLAAHAQFGGDLETMQRCYEWYDLKSEVESLRSRAEKAEAELLTMTRKFNGAVGLKDQQRMRAETAEATCEKLAGALDQCQRALAAMIDPSCIAQTTVIYAFATATTAEATARHVLSEYRKEAPDAG